MDFIKTKVNYILKYKIQDESSPEIVWGEFLQLEKAQAVAHQIKELGAVAIKIEKQTVTTEPAADKETDKPLEIDPAPHPCGRYVNKIYKIIYASKHKGKQTGPFTVGRYFETLQAALAEVEEMKKQIPVVYYEIEKTETKVTRFNSEALELLSKRG